MFGVPLITVIFLSIAAIIAFGLLVSVLSESVASAFPPMNAVLLRRYMERMDNVRKVQVRWGIVAVIFCLLAVVSVVI